MIFKFVENSFFPAPILKVGAGFPLEFERLFQGHYANICRESLSVFTRNAHIGLSSNTMLKISFPRA